jgi:hypothetical protein
MLRIDFLHSYLWTRKVGEKANKCRPLSNNVANGLQHLLSFFAAVVR